LFDRPKPDRFGPLFDHALDAIRQLHTSIMHRNFFADTGVYSGGG
jgi:hypothetical protein